MKFTTVGLQRTGTNYTESFFLKQGFTHVSSSPGNLLDKPFYAWKHNVSPNAFAKDVNQQTHIVIVVAKHPLKWLESILRNPVDITFAYPYLQHGKLLLSKKHSWRLSTFHTLSIEKLFQHYNTFYTNWLNTNLFANQYVARYEDMIDIDYANQFVEDLCYDFNIPFTAIPTLPQNLEMSLGGRSKDYLESYKKRQYNLPYEFIECARTIINPSLLARLDYQI